MKIITDNVRTVVVACEYIARATNEFLFMHRVDRYLFKDELERVLPEDEDKVLVKAFLDYFDYSCDLDDEVAKETTIKKDRIKQ